MSGSISNDTINYMHNTVVEENIGFDDTSSIVQSNITRCAIEEGRESDITKRSEVCITIVGKSIFSNIRRIVDTFNEMTTNQSLNSLVTQSGEIDLL